MTSFTISRITFLTCLFLAIGQLALFAQSKSENEEIFEKRRQIESCAKARNFRGITKYLRDSNVEVQGHALANLLDNKDPVVGSSILDFLSSINSIVEGSEAATTNYHMKCLCFTALKSSFGNVGEVNLREVSEVRQFIGRLKREWNSDAKQGPLVR